MNPPKEVEQLVERFDRNKDQYVSGNYNEAQLCQEFVNPFFIVAKTEQEKTVIQRRIDAIDQLVYQLYNLTDDEIEIVETSNK